LPEQEKANPLVRMDLAYLRKALELRQAEERAKATNHPQTADDWGV
jgi:hypothetical protein